MSDNLKRELEIFWFFLKASILVMLPLLLLLIALSMTGAM